MSNLTIIAKDLSDSELMTESYQTRQYTAISEHSLVKGTPQAIRDWLTLSAGDSLVNHSQQPESDSARMTRATCGLQQLTPYAQLDPVTASLRTFQACLIPGILSESSATLPKAGIACDGVVYQRPSWARTISEIGSGLLPTPTVNMVSGGANHNSPSVKAGKHGLNLAGAVQMWLTPQARDYRTGEAHRWENPERSRNLNDQVAKWPTLRASDYKGASSAEAAAKANARGHSPNLPEAVAEIAGGGKLNPTWVEWLMGWPLGWTDLKHSAMDKFQSWLQQHGDY